MLKNAGQQSKVEQTLAVKSELQEKHKYDIMNKVVLKHHGKQQKQQKQEKEAKKVRLYQIEERKGEDQAFQQKLKSIADERAYRQRQLKEKFEKLD